MKKTIKCSLSIKEEKIKMLSFIRDFSMVLHLIKFAEEFTCLNLDYSPKTANFTTASQVATTVLIQPPVSNVSLAMFWIQTIIVSDVEDSVLHVYKQVLKSVKPVFLDFTKIH